MSVPLGKAAGLHLRNENRRLNGDKGSNPEIHVGFSECPLSHLRGYKLPDRTIPATKLLKSTN